MGRLLQTQRRGKGKAGIESADGSQAHQRPNRILREPRKFKNGKLVKSVGTASMYKQFRTSLSAFTQRQYNKDLSRFYFTDITQKFLLEYIVYLERRGIETVIVPACASSFASSVHW